MLTSFFKMSWVLPELNHIIPLIVTPISLFLALRFALLRFTIKDSFKVLFTKTLDRYRKKKGITREDRTTP